MQLIDFELPLPNKPIQWVANLPRPSWDAFFMMKVMATVLRSPDRQTKQGALIVDTKSHHELASGFNGHPRGTSGLPTMRAGSALRPFSDLLGNQYDVGDKVPDGATVVLRPDQFLTAVASHTLLGNGDFHHDVDANTYTPCDYAIGKFIQGLPDKYTFMCHCETNSLMGIRGHSDDATLYVPMPSCDQCALLMANHPFVRITRIVYYEKRSYPKHLYDAAGVRIEQYDAETHGHPDEWLLVAAQYARLRRLESEKLSKDSKLHYTTNA